ncbi:MAG: hypothetical protein U0350_45420 [Caldilineaceae bacterium]
MRRTVVIICLVCIGLLTACGDSERAAQPTSPMQPTNIVLPVVTPSAVAAKLTPTTTLDEAAKQVAASLDLTPDAIRVRIKANCSVCEAEKFQKATSLNGVSVAEATPLLAANYDFWLFVKNFTCSYHYDGKTYTPKSCQLAPL